MSSSCLKYLPAVGPRGAVLRACTILAFAGGSSAWGQQVYFQPLARVSTNLNTNAALATSGSTSISEGYTGDAGGLLNIASPQTNTIIKPDVGYEDNPKIRERSVLGIVDLFSEYRFSRGDLDLQGQYNYSDTYNSELASANFNPVNPIQPTTPETGRFNVDSNRTLVTVGPTFKYDLTQRLALKLNGVYENAAYGGSGSAGYVPFDYYLGGGSLGWLATPKMELSAGAYESRESAKDGSGSVDATGVTVAVGYKWSARFSGRLELLGERDNSDNVRPIALKETTTSGGGTYTTSWKGEVSTLQLSIGRTFTPSGAGGKYAADQAQIEYQRDLSPRLSTSVAARYIDYIALSTVDAGSEYHYVNSNASLKWKLTPTWYLSGGAQFQWVKTANPSASADNGVLYIAFGYQGLTR
jgi:hypothetical protein